MAIQKQLGQSAPAADTDTVIYTNTSGLEVTGMVMTCCNHHATLADTLHIYQDDDAGLHTDAQMLYSNFSVAAGSTARLAIGPMSTASGTVSVNSVLAHITFTLHGTETLKT